MKTFPFLRTTLASATLLALIACASTSTTTISVPTTTNSPAPAPQPSATAASSTSETPPASPTNTNDPIARIRDEGLNRSQAMEALSYLTDVIGPRLTGSPQMKRANEWTKTKLESWGMTNAQLEAWGPFGRGWSLERFSAHVVEPQYFPVHAYPSAWSPGFNNTLEAPVVYLDASNTNQLEKYKGKLKGAIVLAAPARNVTLPFEPIARRREATNLLALANADVPRAAARGGRGGVGGGTNAPAARRGGGGGGGGWTRFLPFLTREGAALILTPSTTGDAGTIFVSSASVPQAPAAEGTNNPTRLNAYMTNVPAFPAQVTVAVEDYNRLVRMSKLGESLKMSVELRTRFHNDDLMAYNTTAEIPGTDLKDEVVMIGAHLDSWHSGTGATDNGVGCIAAMEALRIIKALDLKPRRTIRVALWSGEEQGLLGSREYVTKHFGKYVTNEIQVAEAGDPNQPARTRATSRRELAKEPGYDKLSAYFNLDNGAGKIRGVYMQGNEAVRPYFRKWLEPFRDLGAETVSPSNTGATDHISFDNVGLPGFQFIQDPLDYSTRTHHSNEDVFDRIQPDDLKQAATIMAAFIYNAAMMDEKLPRKPTE